MGARIPLNRHPMSNGGLANDRLSRVRFSHQGFVPSVHFGEIARAGAGRFCGAGRGADWVPGHVFPAAVKLLFILVKGREPRSHGAAQG